MSKRSEKFGDITWCIKTPVSESGEIHVAADVVETPGGALVLSKREADGTTSPNFIVGPGQWTVCYPMSDFDGGPAAVEHWDEPLHAKPES